jgi:hypothetical protein
MERYDYDPFQRRMISNDKDGVYMLVKDAEQTTFGCLKDGTRCIKTDCNLFMRPNDCAIKSAAIFFERMVEALETISRK